MKRKKFLTYCVLSAVMAASVGVVSADDAGAAPSYSGGEYSHLQWTPDDSQLQARPIGNGVSQSVASDLSGILIDSTNTQGDSEDAKSAIYLDGAQANVNLTKATIKSSGEIAVDNGASLTVNEGSISQNTGDSAGVSADGGTISLNKLGMITGQSDGLYASGEQVEIGTGDDGQDYTIKDNTTGSITIQNSRAANIDGYVIAEKGGTITFDGLDGDSQDEDGTDNVITFNKTVATATTFASADGTSNTESNSGGTINFKNNTLIQLNGDNSQFYIHNGSMNFDGGTITVTNQAPNYTNFYVDAGKDKTGSLTINNATVNAPGGMDVGSDHGMATATISKSTFNAPYAKIIADANGTINFDYTNLDNHSGTIEAQGYNSHIILNGDDTTNYKFGDLGASANGILSIRGGKVSAQDVAFGDTSTLEVDGNQAVKGPVITVPTGKVDIAPDARLYVDNASAGQTYHILSKNNDPNNFWQEANESTNNSLLKFINVGNGLDVKVDRESFAAAIGKARAPRIRLYRALQKVWDNAGDLDNSSNPNNSSSSNNSGNSKKHHWVLVNLISKIMQESINPTPEAQDAAFNSLADMAAMSGANHATYTMNNTFMDSVEDHLSIAEHGQQDKDIWARYIHNKEDVDGLQMPGLDSSYKAQYNGVVVGGDFYKKNAATIGAAMIYGTGDVTASNIAAYSKNDMKYYGLSLYGRLTRNDNALLGDVTYLRSKNDIKQLNSTQEITGNAHINTYSLGLRGEHRFHVGSNGDLVPFVGFRYTHLGSYDFTNNYGLQYKMDDQNIWTMPVGLAYRMNIQRGNWTIHPKVEVGYAWTAGDRDVNQTVTLDGIATNGLGYQVTDSGSWFTKLGLGAENNTWGYGVNYAHQKGSYTQANTWSANLVYKF